jgi:hypothetical protein
VPAGKCLIVESASVLTKLPSGQRAYAQFYGNYKRVGNLYFSLKHQGTFDGREVWTAAEPARIYGSGSAPAFFDIASISCAISSRAKLGSRPRSRVI